MTNLLNTTDKAMSALYSKHETVIDKFTIMVEEKVALLTSEHQPILLDPLSFGKDSTVVALASLEAYRRCIEEGSIEPERPLIMSTGNPMAEALPMEMYPQYAAPRLIAYAKAKGINLYHDFVKPTFYEEYANRYLTAQKMLGNVTRASDCTVILKVVPTERYVKNLLKRFEGDVEMAHYSNRTVICCTGQRNEESPRRSNHMAKQGTSNKNINDLLAEADQDSTKTNFPLFNYCPLRDWDTDEVFMALELAGEKPSTRNLLGIHNAIPGFLPDFALLLAIYGNATNEACEIAVGAKHSGGCNGRARYGCTICPMPGRIDKTQVALSQLPRWQALLQDEMLRVRDYMFRLSTRNDVRMLHAKAFDPTGFSRIALQPNALKPKYLEKLVRYFAQLSIESSRRADEFAQLVREGRVDEHEGVQDIQNDVTLNAKARRAFLEMYIEGAQKPLINLFSERHALYLSFRWSIDGVNSLPYRPFVIWNDLVNGKGWVPYPKLNSEYEAIHGRIELQDKKNPLPNPVMVPVFDEDIITAERYVDDYQHLQSYWSRPIDAADLLNDANCTTTLQHDHALACELLVDMNLSVAATNSDDAMPLKTFVGESERLQVVGFVSKGKASLNGMKVNNKVADEALRSEFESKHLQEFANNHYNQWLDELTEYLFANSFESQDEALEFIRAHAESAFSKAGKKFSVDVPFLKAVSTNSYQAKARASKPALHFTKRVTSFKKGVFTRGNTRMKFYPLEVMPRLHYAHVESHQHVELDFNWHTEKATAPTLYPLDHTRELGDALNIVINDDTMSTWHLLGGAETAVEMHNSFFAQNVQQIRNPYSKLGLKTLRLYPAGAVAEMMVSSGLIKVSSEYLSTYKSLIKRTQLFEEIGVFDYQEYSSAELEALPFTISMAQHRQDKVAVLLAVRERRNATRRAIHQALHNPAVHWAKKVDAFIHNAQQSLWTAVQYEGHRVHKAAFNTNEISFGKKARAGKTWLLMHSNALQSSDDLLKVALSKSEYAQLMANPALLRSTYEQLNNSLEKLLVTVSELRQNWKPVHALVETLLTRYVDNAIKVSQNTEAESVLRADLLKEFGDKIATVYPNVGDLLMEPDARWWTPNLENLVKGLKAMAESNRNTADVLNELERSINAMIVNGLQKAVSELKLDSRLLLLAKQTQTAASSSASKFAVKAKTKASKQRAATRSTNKSNKPLSMSDFLAVQLTGAA